MFLAKCGSRTQIQRIGNNLVTSLCFVVSPSCFVMQSWCDVSLSWCGVIASLCGVMWLVSSLCSVWGSIITYVMWFCLKVFLTSLPIPSSSTQALLAITNLLNLSSGVKWRRRFGYPRVLGTPVSKSLVFWLCPVGIPKTLKALRGKTARLNNRHRGLKWFPYSMTKIRLFSSNVSRVLLYGSSQSWTSWGFFYDCTVYFYIVSNCHASVTIK